jgi:hypothetical protein
MDVVLNSQTGLTASAVWSGGRETASGPARP